MLIRLLLFISLCSYCCAETSFLENVPEDELLALIRNEKFVVVLFTKPDCPECDKLESILINIREDLVDSLNAWVVKAESSYLVKLYDPSKEPSLVFFRHGVPLLYDGEYNEDLIVHVFSENKDPIVKELSDDNFELLTQAATGATTGDWFILFYTNECVDCQRLQARWEAVGAKLKTRLNIARLNIKTSGVTARRFRISSVPTFLFFRLGKMYYYNIPKFDVPSFVSFATDWYKNAKSGKVPLPKAPFDDFIQQIVDAMRDSSLLVTFLAFFTCGILLYILFAMRYGGVKPSEKDKSSSDEKVTKEEKSKKSK
uniref:Transmembrane protein, putative n=1 Tax=Riptortus pedestris TaxID=329032 RepID=R4WCS0_RIPPE|nr:transmembrane protein, putative [Riptortus pedestris]